MKTEYGNIRKHLKIMPTIPGKLPVITLTIWTITAVIAVNQWIDDTYYVDGDGVMAKNSWIQLSEDIFPEESMAGITWSPKES